MITEKQKEKIKDFVKRVSDYCKNHPEVFEKVAKYHKEMIIREAIYKNHNEKTES